MLAVAATNRLTESMNQQLRCGACRYFTLDRCCNTSARLAGDDTRQGECPHFRFALGHSVAY